MRWILSAACAAVISLACGGNEQAPPGVAPQNVAPGPVETIAPVVVDGVQEPAAVGNVPTHWVIPADPRVVAYAGVAARASAVGGSLSEAEFRAVLALAETPAEWVEPMVVIAWCESRFSPYAIGDSGSSLGIMQLWSGWFADGEAHFDPLTNVRVALRVRETRGRFGGQGGWSCADRNGIP